MLTIGSQYECFVNGRVMLVQILKVEQFGGGTRVIFQNAKNPGKKMERYSVHDFRIPR